MKTLSILSRLLVGCIGLLPQSETQTAQPAKVVGEAKLGSTPAVGQVVTLLGIDAPTNAVVFSPDGKLIACGGDDRRVRIFDESGRLITRLGGHAAPIRAVAFSPDGTKIASAGAEKLVTDGPIMVPLEDSAPIPAERPLEKGDRRPITSVGRVWPRGRFFTFHDVQTGTWLGGGGCDHVPPVVSIAFSGDGSTLAMFDSEWSLQLQMTPWTPGATTSRRADTTRDYTAALGVVNSLGGDALRIVSGDQSNKLFGLLELKKPEVNQSHDLDPKVHRTSCAMRLDGKRFVVGSQDGSVAEWDFDKGELIRTFDKGSTGTRPVEFLAYSPDGKQIVSGDEAGVVRLYDAVSTGLLQTRQGPGRPVRAAAFLPLRVKIACGGHYLRTDPKLPQAERGTAEPILVWEMGRD